MKDVIILISNQQLKFMVSMKVPFVLTEITRELGASANEALDMFYRSETYRLLSKKETYYWGESAQFVAESFMREHQGLPIEKFENI